MTKVITEFNERILFVHHSFGLKYKKPNGRQVPRKYQSVNDQSHGLPERFSNPKTINEYGVGCYFNFTYVEDKKTGEWYSYPPSEIIVYAPPVIQGDMTAKEWVMKEHTITSPFVIPVKNGQTMRRLMVWFDNGELCHKFRHELKEDTR